MRFPMDDYTYWEDNFRELCVSLSPHPAPEKGGDILFLSWLSVRLSVRQFVCLSVCHKIVSALKLENRSRYFHETS